MADGKTKDISTSVRKPIEIRIDLPVKISLNEWYSGMHWTKRKKIKDLYKMIVKGNYDKPCEVSYSFTFKSRPLDCSNCVALLKIIEDCLFPNDGIKVVKKLTIESKKGAKDSVLIIINNSE